MWITDQRSTGVVVKEVAPWPYEIALRGGTMRRNRRHLIQHPGNDVRSSDLTPQQPEESTPDNDALLNVNSVSCALKVDEYQDLPIGIRKGGVEKHLNITACCICV